MSGNEIYKRQEDLVCAQIDDSYVILEITTAKYYAFNQSAKDIWDLLAEPISARAIAGALSARYKVSADACYASVVNVIGDLKSKGLVTVTVA